MSTISRVYFPVEVELVSGPQGVTPRFVPKPIGEAWTAALRGRWQDPVDAEVEPDVAVAPFLWGSTVRSSKRRSEEDINAALFAISENIVRHVRSGAWNEPPAMASAEVLFRGAGDTQSADAISAAIELAYELSDIAEQKYAAAWPCGWGRTIWEALRNPTDGEESLDDSDRKRLEELAEMSGFWWEWFPTSDGQKDPWLTPVPLGAWSRG